MKEFLNNHRPDVKTKLGVGAAAFAASVSLILASKTDGKQVDILNSKAHDLTKQWALTLSPIQQKQITSAATEMIVHESYSFTRRPAFFAQQPIKEVLEDRDRFINNASPDLRSRIKNLSNAAYSKFLMGVLGIYGDIGFLSYAIFKKFALRKRQLPDTERSLA